MQIKSMNRASSAATVMVPLRIFPVKSKRIRVTEAGSSHAVFQKDGIDTEESPSTVRVIAFAMK
ncbi:hypothetical protein DW739_09855 [Clostridium sp. AM28-20LB]|nr:hypothetical protein DW739_09855 [Clostridium sp. AM28-20LB]